MLKRFEEHLNLDATIAKDLFENCNYPWEVLPKIKEFIMCSTERKEICLKQRKATNSLKKYTNYFGE